MSNTIKYSESTEQRALNKGNWWIGTGDTNKGPSDVTGYYAGVTPPSSGYTIYIKREDNLPSIFVAENDQELIFLTNQISESNFTTTQECLNYFQTQDDKLCVNREIENIVTDGLVLNLDAGYAPSYPTSGTTWYDLSGNGNDGTLINGPIYSGGSMVFDGVDDYVDLGTSDRLNNNEFTVCFWYNPITPSLFKGIINGKTPNGTFCLYWLSTSTISLQYRDNSGLSAAQGGIWIRTNGPFSISPETWYFIYIIGNELNQYYRCGINEVQSQSQFNAQSITPAAGWILGNRAFSNFSSGKISNVSIYNNALTSTEILQNYNAQKSRFGL